VFHRESPDGEVFGFKNHARFNIEEIDSHGRLRPAQYHPINQVIHAFHRMAAAVNIDFFYGFPAHKGGNQPGQAQDVVQMPMRQQDVIQPFKPDAGF